MAEGNATAVATAAVHVPDVGQAYGLLKLTPDELVAAGIVVVCTLSVILSLLSPVVTWFLKATCFWECLTRLEMQAEMQAEQALLVRELQTKKKVSKYADASGNITVNIVANQPLLVPGTAVTNGAASPSPMAAKTSPSKAGSTSGLGAIAAKAQKAKGASSTNKASGDASPGPSGKKEKPLTVQERRAMRAAALHGEAAGKVSGYGSELMLAEVNAEASKMDDQRKALAVTGKPTENVAGGPKRPRAGVRGHARSRATLVYPGDGVYEGEYVDGLKDGQGRFFYVVGSVYEGQWKHDMKQGTGTEVYADGAKFEGEFNQGTRHGKGTLQYANGDSYEGEWSWDMKHGGGTFRWAAGTVYEGEFREGVMHGNGTYYFADGCTYQGEYEDGKRHGRGIYRFLDGAVFEGEYNEGVVEGRGTFTFADGSTEVGRWEDGWPVGEATRFSPDHKSAWRLVDGHVTVRHHQLTLPHIHCSPQPLLAYFLGCRNACVRVFRQTQGPVSLDIADVIGRMAFKPKPWERAAQLARALKQRLNAMEFEQLRDMAMASVATTAQGGGAVRAARRPGKSAQNVKQVSDHMGRLINKESSASGGDAYKMHMARVHRK